jgi:hypothetical protein
MKITLNNGEVVDTIVTFNNGYSHFIVDDGCYVLINGVARSPWIFPEAFRVLKTLPPLKIGSRKYVGPRKQIKK